MVKVSSVTGVEVTVISPRIVPLLRTKERAKARRGPREESEEKASTRMTVTVTNVESRDTWRKTAGE